MDLPIVNTGIKLFLSPVFLQQVESIVDKNADDNTDLVALFISRLIKGLQNLSKLDTPTQTSTGRHLFTIEDIGVISFIPISDSSSHMQYIAVEQIDWTFSTSFFFNVFTTE